MKRDLRPLWFWIMVYVTAFLPGCATSAHLSGDEVCARMGMKLKETASTNTFQGQHYCMKPENSKDEQAIEIFAKAGTPKHNYNRNLATKRFINGGLYLFWIVPGVAAKFFYDWQLDNAVEESEKIGHEEVQKLGQVKAP